MPRRESGAAYLASGGLILFDACSFYELLAASRNLTSIRRRLGESRSWKAAMRLSFEDAYKIDYETVFLYARKILDVLPSGPATEAALQRIAEAAEHITSNAGLLRHDFTGRVYHSALGRDLAKAFATYYTSIPAAELLAWLAIERWDATVADFACGSGTLLVAAYHRKLALPYLQEVTTDVGELHKIFIEKHIWGFDAMPFASHLSLVNLALQQPNVTFQDSNIFQVPCGNSRLGSLDLLTSEDIVVQRKIHGQAEGATQHGLSDEVANVPVHVPRESFDLVIMNPPFTRKDRATRVLNA